jgi:hypothetical protein
MTFNNGDRVVVDNIEPHGKVVGRSQDVGYIVLFDTPIKLANGEWSAADVYHDCIHLENA